MYRHLKVDPRAIRAVEGFRLPEELGFGITMLPALIRGDYEQGEWGPLRLVPYEPFQIDPAAKVFFYSQEIFEGMKAYRHPELGAAIFRPDFLQERMNRSARRMLMPELPEEYFLEGVHGIAALAEPFIPMGPGESLYLRPYMISTEPGLGLAPSSTYRFAVLALPSSSYFSTDFLDVLIEREYCRAARGGTGFAKTGGNYSAAMQADRKARGLGFQQTVWLDPLERSYVEELSGMNFFALVDGVLETPELTDSILGGSTRDSLMQLAAREGIPVREVRIDINQLKAQIESGRCTEAFVCGTAAIVMSLRCLGEEDGSRVCFEEAPGPVASLLRDKLMGIQQQTEPDEFGWMVQVEPL